LTFVSSTGSVSICKGLRAGPSGSLPSQKESENMTRRGRIILGAALALAALGGATPLIASIDGTPGSLDYQCKNGRLFEELEARPRCFCTGGADCEAMGRDGVCGGPIKCDRRLLGCSCPWKI
jgi:hypothetical protein